MFCHKNTHFTQRRIIGCDHEITSYSRRVQESLVQAQDVAAS
jgi:hypothetical protein